MNRRDFLKAGSLISLGLSVPTFLNRTAAFAADAKTPGAKDTILVVVQLTGGNDGLNTVIPFKDEEYAKIRPTLKQPTDQVKKLTADIALHPSMGELAKVFESGELCVVQGVGYPNPDQSHFRSMDIWQGGSLDKTISEGWLGKAMKKSTSTSAFHVAANNESAPLALSGAPVRAPSITSLEDFQIKIAQTSGDDKKAQRDLIESVAKPGDKPNLLDFVSRTASNTYASSKRLAEVGKNYEPKATYPANNALANRLKLAAQLIDAGLGARIFYVSIDGFDTHAAQATTHANLLGQVSDAMSAFYKDLSARGHKDRLMMMTFSEFGRRAAENGSKGTDHGSAAPMLLVGGKVNGGVVGAHPSLTKLEMGNLAHHTDFRQVYAAILDGWLGISSKDVLGEKFEAVKILKA
jgi:uncharacterized protein (DUF1501 family)